MSQSLACNCAIALQSEARCLVFVNVANRLVFETMVVSSCFEQSPAGKIWFANPTFVLTGNLTTKLTERDYFMLASNDISACRSSDWSNKSAEGPPSV